MTFGIAHSGFTKSDSDGFGKTKKSWGLNENRKRGTEIGEIYEDAILKEDFRELQKGDIFSIYYKRSLGKA